MKELYGTASNVLIAHTDGAFVGMAEIIVIVSEPQYQPYGGVGIVRLRQLETLRFCTGVTGLKDLAKTIAESIAEVEKVEALLKETNVAAAKLQAEDK